MTTSRGAAKKDERVVGHTRLACDEEPNARVGESADTTGARVRTVLPNGTTLWSTPIREYNPHFTADDYAILARLRDQEREHIARGPGSEGTTAL